MIDETPPVKVRAKTLKDYPTFTSNPVRPTGIGWVKEFAPSYVGEAVLTDTGEAVQITRPKVQQAQKDSLEYRKLFVSSFEILRELTPTGQKLLYYIMLKLKKNSDEIFIDVEDCMRFCGIEERQIKTYYRGICDLLEHQLIFRRVGSSAAYFINPNRFFNGDRKKIA